MTAILDTLTAAGVFLAGLAARLGVVVLVMAVLLVPVLAVTGAARALSAVRMRLLGYRSAGSLRFRNGLLYAPGHTWVREEGERLRVGIDDLAQRLLPWAVAVDLPRPGQKVAAGEPVARISCGEQEASVAAPASGTVVAVNTDVLREPTLVKSAGYGRGWLFAIRPDDGAWRDLPRGDAARAWLAAEADRLSRFYEQHLGYAAADGGELVGPPPSLLGDSQWKALVRAFLRT
ncbi:MAG TPA: glycine cleavage system protein H [Anaeromyxobacteraceae bacterium]|nr:glycine cleavage system protein H [Anaeromyxobacteraceae bacterium]